MSSKEKKKNVKRKMNDYALINLNGVRLIVPSNMVEEKSGHYHYISGQLRLPCEVLCNKESKENLQKLDKESSLMEESCVSLEKTVSDIERDFIPESSPLSDTGRVLRNGKKSKYILKDTLDSSDYVPMECDTSDSTNDSLNNVKKKGVKETKNEEEIIITLDKVYEVERSSDGEKPYFCLYCKKDVMKFARHLEDLHSKENKDTYEEEVYEALVNPPFSEERSHLITIIRNKGILLYNSDFKYHKGKLRTTKRLNQNFTVTSKDLTVCCDCHGTYTEKSIRFHRCAAKPRDKVKSSKKDILRRGRSRFMHSEQKDLILER